MPRYQPVTIFVLFLIILVLFCKPVFAYIDPKTTSPVFGVLAPSLLILLVFLGLVLFFLGFLFRPFRRFFRFLFDKVRGRSDSEMDGPSS